MLDPSAIITSGQQIITNIDPAIIEAAAKGLATAFGKVAAETGINFFCKAGSSILDGEGQLIKAAYDLLFPAFKRYVINYNDRHGVFKVLGMGKAVSLDSVYTKVNFQPSTILVYESIDAQEKGFRQRILGDKEKRQGLDVANEEQYLMVLGGPGTGKSTFLRKVGLEALKGNKKEYKHSCIPVLLELRKFNDSKTEIDLVEEIATEFKICGLPEYKDCTQKLLEEGKLLILLDGLDEVANERLSEITRSIRNLLDSYSKNRFIASCRIAAYRNFESFRRFTDVVVAEFEDEQVKTFINKWFESHNQKDWGQKCWEKLNGGEHQATKELTRTPLLLTLICILFKRRGEFPNKRATVYDEALRTLLSHWDASKEIIRSSPYQGMDTRRKEFLLAEVAYENFLEDNLFFQEAEITKQIERILGEMLTDEKLINGRDVLRSIEEQHGVLVSRGDNIYSFSHLTLQEFLTAKQIVDNDIDLKDLVNNYLCDSRWREVFLILAGLKRADSLLKMMAEKIDSLMDTPKLQGLLVWVKRVSDPTSGEIKPVGKRAISLANANANALAYAKPYAYVKPYAYAKPYAYVKPYAYALAYANALAYVLANPNAKVYANALANDLANGLALDKMINYVQWSKDNEIYQGINLTEIISQLEQSKTEIPDDSQSQEDFKTFTQKLIRVVLDGFHLTPEMFDFSELEREKLNNYLYANKLMVECKEAAVRVTPKVWEKIEEGMLLPKS